MIKATLPCFKYRARKQDGLWVCQNVTPGSMLKTMLPLAAELASHPLSRSCLLGCAASFLLAALLDGFSGRDASGKAQAGGL